MATEHNLDSEAAVERAAVAQQVLGGGIAVAEKGAGNRLAGPGTGRATSQPTDARPERATSRDPEAFGIPQGREEDWRFTPLDRLRPLLDPAESAGEGKLLADVHAPDAVEVRTVDRDDPAVGQVLEPVDRVSALAWASWEQALVVTVPPRVVLDEPVRVTLRGEAGRTWSHVVVDVGAEAQAVVVVERVGDVTVGANTEVRVGDNASLTLVNLVDWDDDAVHVEAQPALVGRDARLKSVTVTLGGDLVRLNPTVRFAGPGGDAELLGLYFADAGQHLEHRLLVDHDQPNCRSRVTYKGALQGDDAHAVWIGDVVIQVPATGTDTYELNRNLLLTDGARADSVPNLEIETGEVVGAGHASATGRFDDEQLFYLQSRGIPAEEARRLVVRGFFADVIAQIGIPEIEQRLTQAIEDELAVVGA